MRRYPESPRIGVGGLVVADGKIALVRRSHPPMQGQWTIPGGLLELGEATRDAVAREILEETGLEVEPGDLLGVFDRVLRDAEGRIEYHYVLIDFLCRMVSGVLRAGSDASEARWFLLEELGALGLAQDTLEVIRRAFAVSKAADPPE